MLDPLVLIAIIGLLTVVCTGSFALAQVKIMGNQATSRQKEDWKRQDEVAARAAETAAVLLKSNRAVLQKTEEVARVAAIATDETHSQLRQIHAFVNSDLTKVLQADLDQTRMTLVVLRKLVGGRDYVASQEDVSLIKTTEARILELDKILSRRPSQLLEVEREIKDAKDAKDAKEYL